MDTLANKISLAFTERYKSKPHLYFSPGRINLIGEHVDYNDGFVLPAAIDKGICYGVNPNETGTLDFFAIDFNETLSINISDVKKMNGWKNYVLSVVNEFILLKKNIGGFNCAFGGNIADGAGMSSSAAVEGGLAFAINELFDCGLNRVELALLCQRAEHNYPGVKCGIMDQYANMMGKKDHVILLDCRSVTHEYFPLNLNGHSIILINTNVHHSLASSEYNVRRKQCEEGLMIMHSDSAVKSFRDISKPENLLAYKDRMGEEVYMRCLFVVEEILRTQEAAKLLKDNRIDEFGKLMFESHAGLKTLYQVSCKELDFLVDQAKENKNVIGSRMMGGGFGGCTINIVKDEAVEAFTTSATDNYKKQFNIDASVYRVLPEHGTRRI